MLIVISNLTTPYNNVQDISVIINKILQPYNQKFQPIIVTFVTS